jgi:hypothetical protein
MIELAVPKKRKPYTVLCGQCGEMPKDCRCAEIQEEAKKREVAALMHWEMGSDTTLEIPQPGTGGSR